MAIPQFIPSTKPGYLSDIPPREVKFGVSWLWDFENGDFNLDPYGGVTRANGEEAWQQWCVKAVLTPRYEHAIYPSDYGSELNEIIRAGYSYPIARVICESSIRDTLSSSVDQRCKEVDNFTFSLSSDGGMEVSFIITPEIGEKRKLEVKIV